MDNEMLNLIGGLVLIAISLIALWTAYIVGHADGYSKCSDDMDKKWKNQRDQDMWSNFINQFQGGDE